MANKAVYHGISLEKEILEKAKRYAKEEGFTSAAAFIKWLINSYPFIKALKQMCEQGLIPAPNTQAPIHKSQSLPERQLPPTFCGNSQGLVLILNIIINPTNINIFKEEKIIKVEAEKYLENVRNWVSKLRDAGRVYASNEDLEVVSTPKELKILKPKSK